MIEMTKPEERIRVFHGDSRDVLKVFPDAHFDSVVCDPPYALVSIVKRFGAENAAPVNNAGTKAGNKGDPYARASAGFMGQKWDTGETAFAVEFWAEVYRVLKPGGHVIAFSGTRTYHRLACAIEDAGFEIRDMVAWLYGSGFPKSHDVSKGIDKARHGQTDVLRVTEWIAARRSSLGITNGDIDAAAGTNGMAGHWTTQRSQAAIPTLQQWVKIEPLLGPAPDWMVPLIKPSREPGNEREITREASEEYRPGDAINFDQRSSTARERRDIPVLDDAAKWQGWGTALKPALEPIVLARKPLAGTVAGNVLAHGTGALNIDASRIDAPDGVPSFSKDNQRAGVTFDVGSNRTGETTGKGRWPANCIHDGSEEVVGAFPESKDGTAVGGLGRSASIYGTDTGGPAGGDQGYGGGGSVARFFYSAKADAEDRLGSKHPTVKPVDLMAYLVRLVTPLGGVTLDPFAGSGTTGVGAMRGGFGAVLIEREDAYVSDIMRKLAWARGEGRLTSLELARLDTPEAQSKASGADLPLFG